MSSSAPRVQAKLEVGSADDPLEREADRIADAVVGMGDRELALGGMSSGPRTVQRKCAACEQEDELIRGKDAAAPGPVSGQFAGAIDSSSGGRPLSTSERNYFEPRFGYSFDRVRVHEDAQAAQLSSQIGARAFTYQNRIFLGAGQYRSGDVEGRRLLAHELAHTVQQHASSRIVWRQARPRPAAVDASAQAIIDLAADSSTAEEDRAIAVVRAIIDQYFPDDASKVGDVRYIARLRGLRIAFIGRGPGTTGRIEVGSSFLHGTDQRNFARRVLQVRHEIEHVEQVRSGMVGPERRDEREFIAFYHGALATELPGTGRMQYGTRVELIDAALGYYFCLDSSLQSTNTSRRDELISRRPGYVRRSGRDNLGDAPTSCRRQPGDSGIRRRRQTPTAPDFRVEALLGGASVNGESAFALGAGFNIGIPLTRLREIELRLGAQGLYLRSIPLPNREALLLGAAIGLEGRTSPAGFAATFGLSGSGGLYHRFDNAGLPGLGRPVEGRNSGYLEAGGSLGITGMGLDLRLEAAAGAELRGDPEAMHWFRMGVNLGGTF